jgi:hypothetical protein
VVFNPLNILPIWGCNKPPQVNIIHFKQAKHFFQRYPLSIQRHACHRFKDNSVSVLKNATPKNDDQESGSACSRTH